MDIINARHVIGLHPDLTVLQGRKGIFNRDIGGLGLADGKSQIELKLMQNFV